MWNWASGANVASTFSGMLAPAGFFIGLSAFFATLFFHFHEKQPRQARFYKKCAWFSFIIACFLFVAVPNFIVKMMESDETPTPTVQQNVPPQPVPPPPAKPTQTGITIERSVSVTAPQAGGDQTHYLDAQAASYLTKLLKEDGFTVFNSEDKAPIHIEILDVTANETPPDPPGSTCPGNHSEQDGKANVQISVVDNSGENILSQPDFSGSSISCMEDLNAEQLDAESSAWQNAVSNASNEIKELLTPKSVATTH